jgi:hypothetical protein
MLTKTQLTPVPNMPSPNTKVRLKASFADCWYRLENKITILIIAMGHNESGAKDSGNKVPAIKRTR